jgi:hypothetical protein
MGSYKSVNFDELSVQGGTLSFGMQSQVLYRFKGRGGQITVERDGASTSYAIPGGEKVHVVGHTAHFKVR